jgi:acyl carrier protein
MEKMQGYDEILQKLYDILKPFVEGGIALTEETDLIADLDLDSLKIMNLLLAVEDTFDISVPLNVLPDIRTIRDFAQQLHQLMKEG